MKKRIVVGFLIVSIITLSGCSLIRDILSDLGTTQKTSEKEKDKEQEKSPYSQTEVLCTYFHYFKSDTFEQWWFPGKEPSRIRGPEPWRRDIWIGRTGDYPYIGMYNNVKDGELIRWHIRLAQASGITAFLLFVNDWEQEAPQTTLLLDVAAQEGFKIGFIEHHSYLGSVPRSILDGRRQPLLPRKYTGYHQIMEQHSRELSLPLSSERTKYIRPEPRSLRDVPLDALERASTRISNMLKQWKSHPAYLRIDGKPIIVIPYMDMNLTSAEFKTLVDGLTSNVGEELYVVAIVPPVYWYFNPNLVLGSGINKGWAASGANAFTHWTPNGMLTIPQKTRLKITKFNVTDSLKWNKDPMIPVMPGFDDDAWQPGDDPAPASPRDNGQVWSAQLDAALAAKPRFIFVQGWNEWHEGSQIEPSTYYSEPYLYLRILAQKLDKPWQTPPLPPQSSVDPLRLQYLPY